jgi:hypothetical protein
LTGAGIDALDEKGAEIALTKTTTNIDILKGLLDTTIGETIAVLS